MDETMSGPAEYARILAGTPIPPVSISPDTSAEEIVRKCYDTACASVRPYLNGITPTLTGEIKMNQEVIPLLPIVIDKSLKRDDSRLPDIPRAISELVDRICSKYHVKPSFLAYNPSR